LKLKAGALPYHLRRSNKLHHEPKRNPPHTNNARKQRTQQDTTPPQTGRRVKEATTALRHRRQRCATAKVVTRCKFKWPPELLHHELSPSRCAHMVVDLSAPMLLRQNTSVAAPMRPPNLTTLRGGLASSTTSLHCQGLGYLRLLRKNHLHSAITKITTKPSEPTRGYTPMGPLHLPTNTNQVHLLYRCERATPPTTITIVTSRDGSQMRCLQEGHDTNVAVITRPQKDKVFTMRTPCNRDKRTQWCPQQGRRHTKGVVTIATDKASMEAFAYLFPTTHPRPSK
jgi:hypothetical protein